MNLSDCVNNGLGAELFLLCSPSAVQLAVAGRDRLTQALLPIEPTFFCSNELYEVLDNEECKAIIAAIGAGIQIPGSLPDSLNTEAMRYERLIIVAERGVQGSTVLVELKKFFKTYCPPLISQGRILVCDPLNLGTSDEEFRIKFLDPGTRCVKRINEF